MRYHSLSINMLTKCQPSKCPIVPLSQKDRKFVREMEESFFLSIILNFGVPQGTVAAPSWTSWGIQLFAWFCFKTYVPDLNELIWILFHLSVFYYKILILVTFERLFLEIWLAENWFWMTNFAHFIFIVRTFRPHIAKYVIYVWEKKKKSVLFQLEHVKDTFKEFSVTNIGVKKLTHARQRNSLPVSNVVLMVEHGRVKLA